MTISTTDFYRSSNGDHWKLIHDPETGHYMVRLEPNLASGGQVTDTGVDEFLARSGASPQHETLRALLEKDGTGDGNA